MATATALSTVEVLEQVLLHLSMLEVTTKRSVCRLWYRCIKDSPLLQQKLWLAPMPDRDAPKESQHFHYTTQSVMVNPLLSNVFRICDWGFSSSISIEPWRLDETLVCRKHSLDMRPILEDSLKLTPKGRLQDAKCRPIRLSRPTFYRIEREPGDSTPNDEYDISSLLATERTGLGKALPCTVEGWGNMLLTQPPIPTVTVVSTGQGEHFGTIQVIAADGKGVKLGELLKSAGDYYARCRLYTSFGFGAQMEIYQPLGDLRFPRFRELFDGRCASADHCKRIGLRRAWKTTLAIKFR